MAKNGKQILKHCNYDSLAKFKLEGVVINTVILYFIDKNEKNIVYLSLSTAQWFTIGGTSPQSRLTISWSEKQLLSWYVTSTSLIFYIIALL